MTPHETTPKPGSPPGSALWTLAELREAVEAALAVGYPGPPSGRVRAVPDERVIRYYITLGLLDRPLAFRGRTALYGRRHLLQIVAVKRLQAEGVPLSTIQARLAGLSDGELEPLARIGRGELPEGASPSILQRTPKPAVLPRRTRAFWEDKPAPAALHSTALPEPSLAVEPQALRVEECLLLIIDALRPIEEADREAVQSAASILIRTLEKRGLIRPHRPGKEHP
ncbi:MAG: MerR family transcriptional regulator [Planctomycetota bacterium]